MKASRHLETAARYRLKMQAALDAVNVKLVALLEQENASVFYQPSDGWVVLFDDACNAALVHTDLDALFKMDRESALDYLRERAI